MSFRIPFYLFAATLACALSSGGRAEVVRTDVFVSGRDGYHTYRIPSILRSPGGDLLAFCEGRRDGGGDTGNIDLLVKRSSDGGRTWGPATVIWDDGDNTCGNPCPVVDATTGEILLLACHNPGPAHEAEITAGTSTGTRTVWLLKSGDDGRTWSAPCEITDEVKKPDWGWYATGPGISIQLQHGPHAGRIVVPCNHSYHEGGHLLREAHVIYSDDHGATWQLGGTVGPDTNESQVAEVPDGRGTLLINMRSYAGHHCRAQSTSEDGGLTWTPPADVPALVEPVCQGSILTWNRATPSEPLMLFSNPANATKRLDLTARASTDGGRTWSLAVLLQPGPGAYSCLVAIDDTAAGCLYECGPKKPYAKIVFARFTADDFAPVGP